MTAYPMLAQYHHLNQDMNAINAPNYLIFLQGACAILTALMMFARIVAAKISTPPSPSLADPVCAGAVYAMLTLEGVETMPKQPADTQAARELSLYAVNDATIYRQKIQPIIKNLARKIKRGTYNAALTPKAWRCAADLAAIRYTCDFDANTTGPFGCFTPATRDLAAVEIAEHYAQELQEATA